MVLLENKNHLLPLQKGEKVALYGVGASKTIKGGTGFGDVNERESVSAYEGMKNAGFQITNECWIRDFEKRYEAARNVWQDDILERSTGKEGAMNFFKVYSETPFMMPSGRLDAGKGRLHIPDGKFSGILGFRIPSKAGKRCAADEEQKYCSAAKRVDTVEVAR